MIVNRDESSDSSGSKTKGPRAFNTLPPDEKARFHQRMDGDVRMLRAHLLKLRFARGGAAEIVEIFQKWDNEDRDGQFNGRLIKEFTIHRVSRVVYDKNIGLIGTETISLLEDLRRSLKKYPYASAPLEFILTRRVGISYEVHEPPSLTRELKDRATELLVNLPTFLAGLGVGAGEALLAIPLELLTQAAKFLELSRRPDKFVDLAIELWDLVKKLPGIGKSLLKQWTQGNPIKRVYFQGRVIGNLLVGIATGGFVAARFAKVLSYVRPKIGSGLRNTLKKLGGKKRKPGSETRGPSSRLVPGSGLSAHELAGGHTLARHVGQSAGDLAARLAAQSRIPAVSTFRSRAAAEAAITSALEANEAAIQVWLRGGGGNAGSAFTTSFANPIGSTLRRGAARPVPVSAVRVVLRPAANMPGGFRILTAFPE